MIYECTDCRHCANFDGGFRIYCLHPEKPPDEVLSFEPLGMKPADQCSGFDEGESHDYSWNDVIEYEKWSIQKYDDISYESVREWCEKYQR